LTVVLGAFQFEVLGQTQAGFQGRRRNRLEHEIRDMIVQSTPGQGLAHRSSVGGLLKGTEIAQSAAVVVIDGEHAMAAAATDQKPGQQGRPMAGHPQVLAAVRRHSLLVRHVLVPADVRRIAVPQNDDSVAQIMAAPSPRCRPARLPTRVQHRTPPVGINAGVAGMMQHVD
jgi:hypothetical protein